MLITFSFFTSIILCSDLVGDRTDGSNTSEENITKLHGGQKNTAKNMKTASSLHLWPEAKCKLLNLDFGFNAFDDQYRGCTKLLEEDVMPKILTLEKAINLEFGLSWNRAEVRWEQIKTQFRLPPGFKDEFGTAVIVYTTDWPKENPIYKVFNENVSTAGKSRTHYIQNFHFKSLHFYLTRALQTLKKTSKRRHQTFRGTDESYEVSESVLRFGRFTSSSLNIEVAKEYYSGLLFEIVTCFGVDIHKLSSFPEEKEVLIPVAEKFIYRGKKGNMHVIDSTCELCSYFNCALFGEEKLDVPVCSTSAV
ncbi:ecto-ADP-ribosyltransferase 5-like [Pelobates fuscus]|uniref:ecto-ADP-ribosyltransferase 5-like n=1 Tax=Pelobates fuscus TaxID=191477 RepID=UPI002FE4AAC5